MSLSDESFPHDEFFDLDLSPSPKPRIQFPHRLRQPTYFQSSRRATLGGEELHTEVQCARPVTVTDGNSSGTTSQCTDQTATSSESLNDQRSRKVYTSDPTDLAVKNSKQNTASIEHGRKSLSHQDIHTEYTKRRYKHVESKVGQYIANMRSEDAKRRNALQVERPRSMPETLAQANNAREDQHSTSMDDMDHVTSASTTLSSTPSLNLNQSSGRPEEHCSDEASTNISSANGDCLDKQSIAFILEERERMQSYNDYLQLKLDEKMSENIRLKHNVDFMRVRLCEVEKQLKQQQQSRQTGRFSIDVLSSSNLASASNNGSVGRQSLQTLLYCPAKTTTTTQTDRSSSTTTSTQTVRSSSSTPKKALRSPTPPPPPPPSPSPLNLGLPHDDELYLTPDTPATECTTGGGCTRGIRNVAALQPISLSYSHYTEGDSDGQRLSSASTALRRRSNSNTHQQQQQQQQQQQPQTQHNSGSSHPSSGDSAIEVEVIELRSSPRRNRRKRYSSSPKPSPPGHAVMNECNGVDRTTTDMLDLSHVVAKGSGMRGKRKHSTKRREHRDGSSGNRLRRFWLRFWPCCLHCSEDPRKHRTLEKNTALQQSYTQVPLWEASSDESYQSHGRII